jgi:acyl-CoA dehydrogenase
MKSMIPEPEYVEPLRKYLAKESPSDVVRRQDDERKPPLDLLRGLGNLGYLTAGLPEAWGGFGTFVDATRIMEEVGRANLALGHLAGRSVYGIQSLIHFGSDEQQQRWIPPLSKGEIVFAIALTEPDAGSDASAIRTRATRDGEEWVVSGEKVFSSSFEYAGVAMTSVRTNPNDLGRSGISTILIEPTTSGITWQRLETLGDWAIGTYRVFFDDVRVPANAVLGEVNHGWDVIGSHLARERLIMAARAIGATQSLLDETADYVCNRQQFGKPLSEHQAVQHKLADIRLEVQVARSALYDVAREEADGGAEFVSAASVKVFASEMYLRAANSCLQMTGGYGYTRDFPAERHLRDARVYVIGGGSSEVMRNIIAREVLREPRSRARS